MIWGVLHKRPGWQWWDRFKSPFWRIQTNGCFSNACGDAINHGCSCNDFHAIENAYNACGWRIVAVRFPLGLPGFYRYWKSEDGDFVEDYHRSGR